MCYEIKSLRFRLFGYVLAKRARMILNLV